jgi:NAD-dependent deacetylase
MDDKLIYQAVELIKKSKHTTAFTGAGISVESGIPPFRGEGGLWKKYDPRMLDIDYFMANPVDSWFVIKEVFYDFMGNAKPNEAHNVLARMESKGLLQAIITQNIDNLHYEAGSKNVYEFHGNSQHLVCLHCETKYNVKSIDLKILPPKCPNCGEILKPDFVFFGEEIPTDAYSKSVRESADAELFIVIGTTGEVMPACSIPIQAKRCGARIIEINPDASSFTDTITDIYLQGKASEIMSLLEKKLY